MTIQELQDKLRIHIRTRIERGELTGTGLSREAGFRQGHLSNFLSSRRGLSMESMDRLLDSLGIGLLDLVEAEDIQRRAVPAAQSARFEDVALVSEENAGLARFTADQILETRSFSKSFLRKLKLKASGIGERADWLRFILVKLDAHRAGGLLPARALGATLLLDRHYISLLPHRHSEPNLYAVNLRGHCFIGYITAADEFLFLRPHNPRRAAELIRIAPGKRYDQYIVGRVCQVSLEV